MNIYILNVMPCFNRRHATSSVKLNDSILMNRKKLKELMDLLNNKPTYYSKHLKILTLTTRQGLSVAY